MDRRRAAALVSLVLVSAVAGPALAAGGLVEGAATGASPAVDGRAEGIARADALAYGPPSASLASNGLAQYSLQPAVVEAAPGEEVTISVVLRSSPQIASGAYKAGFVLEFNASVLRATNVSQGPFMGMRRNTTVRTNQSAFDNEQGFVLYELVRDPPNGGVAGAAAFAYVTFEVREDAAEGGYPISFFRTLVLLTDGNFQQVTRRGGELVVNRSAATSTPTGTGPAVTATPTDTRTVAASPTAGGGGPGAVVGVVALVGTLGLLAGVLVLVRRA